MPSQSSAVRRFALVLTGCLATAGVMWAATSESLPWLQPAEAHGWVAPYSLPRLKQAPETAQIAFLEQRIAQQPEGFSDLAQLASAYVHRARVTFDPSWYLLAEQAANRSLANMPLQNPAARLVLCQVALARHDFPTATRLANAIAIKNPIAVRPLRVTLDLATGQVAEANRLTNVILAGEPSCAGHVQRALTREAMGDDAGAIADYHWALAREEAGYLDTSVLARTWLGRLHARNGRLATAVDLYREALKLQPDHAATLALLGDAELRLGDPTNARVHFEQAVTGGLGAPALMGLARAEAALGHTQASQAALHEAEGALRRDLVNGGFGHRRDLARLLMDRNTPEASREALGLMQQEVALRQDELTWDLYARALQANGQLKSAATANAKALGTGARDPEAYGRAALIAKALGHLDVARADEATMHHINPGFHMAEATAGVDPGS